MFCKENPENEMEREHQWEALRWATRIDRPMDYILWILSKP